MPPADPTAGGGGHTYKMLNFVVVSFRLYSVLLAEASAPDFPNEIWGGNFANNYGGGQGQLLN